MPAPRFLDERAVEAFLSGRSVAPGDAPELTAFVEDLRAAVSGPPPVPTQDLARMMREGFSIDSALPTAAVTAAPLEGTVTEPTGRRAKMGISGLFAGLTAKLAGLGMAGKAALGLTVAAASVTTAGAAGVLPHPAQHAVATVVNAASPFDIPDVDDSDTAGSSDDQAVLDPVTGLPVTDPVDDGTSDEDSTGGGVEGRPTDNHGACVSAVAKNAPTGAGGVDGQAVSEAAKTCPKATEPVDDGETTTTTTLAMDDPDDTGTDAADAPGNSTGNRGNGNGGNGNGGNGNGAGQASNGPNGRGR